MTFSRLNNLSFFLAISGAFLISTIAGAKTIPKPAQRVLVRYKKNTGKLAKQKILMQTAARRVHQFRHVAGLEIVELMQGSSVQETVATFRKNPDVLYAEPDSEVHILDVPNDASFSSQWGLHNTGQVIESVTGIADFDINAPEGWDITTGDGAIVIGVIDTGINYEHPDLIDNLWTNPDEIPGNGIDDDNNLYIDDVYGANTVDGSGDPLDDNGHGTHVAGTIAAVGNNSTGVSGVMREAQIISCKFLNESGSGTVSGAILCLEYLSDLEAGMIVTNNSWGGGDYSQALYDAILGHLQDGILFIAAAGNDTLDNDQNNSYPANYGLPNIISVAAIDNRGEVADFSNTGQYSVHVGAPGVDILSTHESGYDTLSGTSMATPHVTGLAGLIKAADGAADWVAIKNLILSAGKPLDSLEDTTISGRLIRVTDSDGMGSLTCSGQILTKHLAPNGAATSLPIGTEISLNALNINCDTPLGERVITINGDDVTLQDDGTGADIAANDGVCSSAWNPPATGLYDIEFSDDDIVSVNIYDASDWQRYGKVSTPEIDYRDVSGGTALPTGDESLTVFVSPFPIRFGGDNSNLYQLYIGSNGTISLTNNLLPSFLNAPLPQSRWTSLIAAYWDDLIPLDDDAGIFYEVQGDAPNRELIIEWRDMRHYQLPTATITFQVVIFENSANILINYLDTNLGNSAYNGGNSATIGIQAKSNLSFQYGSSVSSNSSLLFQLGSASSGGGSGGGGGGGTIAPISNRTPSEPTLAWPPDNATIDSDSPTVVMASASDADSDDLTYELEVFEGDLSGPSVIKKGSLTSNVEGRIEAKLTGLGDGKKYLWRARAFDGKALGKYAQRSFSVKLVNASEPAPQEQAVFRCKSSGTNGSDMSLGILLLLGLFFRLRRHRHVS